MSLKIWQEAAILTQRLFSGNSKFWLTGICTPLTSSGHMMAITRVCDETTCITLSTNPSSVTMSRHLPEADGLR
jgi:hypothetical protein